MPVNVRVRNTMRTVYGKAQKLCVQEKKTGKAKLKKLRQRFAQSLKESKRLQKKVNEKQAQLDVIEETFVAGDIAKELYQELSNRQKEELQKSDTDSSHLEKTS